MSVAKIIVPLQRLSESSLGCDSRLIRYSGNFLSVLALQPLPLHTAGAQWGLSGGSVGAPGRQVKRHLSADASCQSLSLWIIGAV